MKIKNLLQWGTSQLAKVSSAQLDAELLLAEILRKERTYLMAHDEVLIPLSEVRRFRYWIKKRKTQMPIAYILGRKEFYGLDFKVNKYVLIPRPDTEILVEAVISCLKPNDFLLDIGTGSGCIPISILKNNSQIKVIALDVSSKALKVAEENAENHQIINRIQFICSDLLRNIPLESFKNKRVVVTANLPYVPHDYPINQEAEFEPSLALYAKNKGLELYQKLFEQLEKIKPKVIFLECYDFQVENLVKHYKNYQLKEVKPLLGKARMLRLESI